MPTHFKEAAHRTFKDAHSLYRTQRLGTPDQLFGLAAECALKAVLEGTGHITEEPPEKRFRVHIKQLWPQYNAALHGRAALLIAGDNLFADWNVAGRYASDGACQPANVARHAAGAKLAMGVLERASLDGVVA